MKTPARILVQEVLAGLSSQQQRERGYNKD